MMWEKDWDLCILLDLMVVRIGGMEEITNDVGKRLGSMYTIVLNSCEDWRMGALANGKMGGWQDDRMGGWDDGRMVR